MEHIPTHMVMLFVFPRDICQQITSLPNWLVVLVDWERMENGVRLGWNAFGWTFGELVVMMAPMRCMMGIGVGRMGCKWLMLDGWVALRCVGWVGTGVVAMMEWEVFKQGCDAVSNVCSWEREEADA